MLLKKKPLNKRAFRKSIWSSLSRVIGIVLGVEAGSMLHRMVGDGLESWKTVSFLAVTSFALMMYAEYERET